MAGNIPTTVIQLVKNTLITIKHNVIT